MKTLQILLIALLLGITCDSFADRPTTLWRNIFDGPTHSVDNFVDMVVDIYGNTYVLCGTKGFISGYDVNITTYKVNTAGQLLWSRTYNGPGNHSLDIPKDIVYDPAGYVIIMGELRDSGIVAIKYDLNGNQQWVYQSPVAADVARSMEIDNSGNVYIAGNSREPGSANYNALLIKLSTGGSQLFRLRPKYGGTTTAWVCEIMKILHDGFGNILAIGNCRRSNGNQNSTFVVKFNPGGGETWKYIHFADSVYVGSFTYADVTMDGSGNVYTASFNSQGDNNYNDALVMKFNLASGGPGWTKKVDPGNTGFDYIKSIRADNAGFIYLSTFSRYQAANASHLITKMSGTNGDTLWTKEIRSFGTTSNSAYTFNDLLVEDNGNFYVATPDLVYDIKKYNTNGDTIWNKTVLGGFSGNIGGYSWMDKYLTTILKGPGGKLYFGSTGTVNNNFDTANVLTAVLSENTSVFVSGSNWGLSKVIGDNLITFDTIQIVTDNPAEVISDVNVSIDTVIHTNDDDLEFYLSHGGETDTLIYQNGGSGDNFIGTLLDDQASVNISSGTAPFSGSYKPFSPLSKFHGMNASGAWILKVYDRSTGNTGTLNAWSIIIGIGGAVNIQQTGNTIPDKFLLSQNYPNPFNPSTKIHFDIPNLVNGNTKLAVYDITGREVALVVNEHLSSGAYEYIFEGSALPSGVYFYKLEAGNFVETKKMLLIK